MKPSNLWLWLILGSLMLSPIVYRATDLVSSPEAHLEFDAASVEAGRDLFMHEWTIGDPLASEGDGLGPVFNAASCLACHRQGGPGGGGPLERNVTTFLVRDIGSGDKARQFVQLTPSQQKNLMAFLKTLRAPSQSRTSRRSGDAL